MYIGDAQFPPELTGMDPIDVPPGEYEVSVFTAVNTPLASRMRAVLVGSRPKRGKQLGETWADTGTQGIGDFAAFKALPEVDEEDEPSIYDEFDDDDESYYDTGRLYVRDAEAGAVLAWWPTGSGDGDFPVYELTHKGKRCGIEVVFFHASGRVDYRQSV